MAVDDAYTKSLLHFNGADGSTTFTDESGKTWARGGDAQIDTAQYKFGGASGLFDGTGDYIETADHDDWNIGSGDFTADCWIRPAADNQDYKCLFGQAEASGLDTTKSWLIWLRDDESVEGLIASGGTLYYAKTAASTYAANTWLHLALVRYGNSLTLYANGVAGTTVADVTGVSATNSAGKLSLGRMGEYNGTYYNGWIDEFRFSKGIARWTANFTPPDRPYGFVSGCAFTCVL